VGVGGKYPLCHPGGLFQLKFSDPWLRLTTSVRDLAPHCLGASANGLGTVAIDQ